MKKNTIILGLVMLVSGFGFSQTQEERAQIIKNYDLEKLEELRQQFKAQEEERKARVNRLAEQNGWEKVKIYEDGSKGYLYDIINNRPIYKTTNNFIAAQMQGAHHLWNGGSLGLNIEGQNMEVGIWDGGGILKTHEALVGRVIDGEFMSGTDAHATHVAGTIIANGPNISAKGIAPQATLKSYDFGDNNDLSEALQEASNGMLVSNHSYGVRASTVSTSVLGKYTGDAPQWDVLAYNAPYYLSIHSAGNERNSGVNNADNGYDLLTYNKVSKNTLTVGATIGNPNYSGPSSVPMSSFSSWGPTDDGRIKPDISTKGVSMLSTENTSNSAYGSRQGTSMSAPAVSGGLILLQQYYNQLNSQYMKAATLKGVTLHTVKEAGAADGPDYQFGWGLMDTEAAAIAIRDNGNDVLIEENNLGFGTNYVKTFSATTASKLIVSISWTDFELFNGGNNNSANDDPTPALRNNLDVTVNDSSGNTFYSWKLNVVNYNAPATNNSLNDVDNFEKVEINNPSGNYTVTVSHRGVLQGGSQDYSLIITGADQNAFSINDNQLDKFSMYPNPATSDFTVAFSKELSGDYIDVVIYDVLGQEVKRNKFDNNNVFEERISTTGLNSGIYLVKVGNGVTSSTQKLIIE